MDRISYKPIGIIYSPFKEPEGVPIQPIFAKDVYGRIEIFPEYEEGLKDLNGFSHCVLIYHFHRAGEPKLIVRPFLDPEPKGVFSTRAPVRPNPIGLSIVRLLRIEKNVLHIAELDILDSTPLLDIKPYVPKFDIREHVRAGWLEKKTEKPILSKDDGRFSQNDS
ncbi:MAG: tRNA (N6-threonylcarbamoyladenosine(37)-N6)-methyltransferase TrmO [Deltaproteobacteria bacterium]|nr:MAG: tRNA (N6-threonylcarbamoyladenosine(37)-N6)-methyltransferase TrmO [Deltaproteobacteria bacterium]